ncbi:uncharacterized protein DAT39_007859, partial [Clarias magur]
EDTPIKAKKPKKKMQFNKKIMDSIKESCSTVVGSCAVDKLTEKQEMVGEIERLKKEIKNLEEDWKYERSYRLKAERTKIME